MGSCMDNLTSAAKNSDEIHFSRIIESLEAEFRSFGVSITYDAHLRELYRSQIREMSSEITRQVSLGGISWSQAATNASELRNTIMELIRDRSLPIGRAVAQKAKEKGLSLNEAIGAKTVQLFGKDARFAVLSSAQRDMVFAAVVKSAGESRASINRLMHLSARGGRGLIFVSLAISVYDVATAADPYLAAGREATFGLVGIMGHVAGGMLAGLACGPGAPVCVGIGAFVGGATAAFSADEFW